MWSDILLHNRLAVSAGLAATRERLAHLEQALAAGDDVAVRAWLEAGRAGRRRFEHHAVMDVPRLGEEA
jgi:prephenate dehydrogenase